MAEYIDKQAFNDAIREAVRRFPNTFYNGLETARQIAHDLPAADVRPVVTCAECKWWTKQEASLQGRCELLQMYPTGAWFCANGKREES